MEQKMKSAIEKITLNDATFSGEVVEPTFVNFFYGRNGASKSTIARTLRANSGVQWQEGRSAADYDVLVYDTEFIDDGVLDNVFRVLSLDAELEELSLDASIVQVHQHSAGAKKGASK